MRRFIPKVKSEVLVCYSKMIVYYFVDPGSWENLWKTGNSRKRAYWLWYTGTEALSHNYIGGWRKFHEYMPAFFLFFGDKKRITCENSIHLCHVYFLVNCK